MTSLDGKCDLVRSCDLPRVAIIILNWNGWEDTADCLKSLNKISYKNYDIIVVENGSTDASPEKLKELMKNIAKDNAMPYSAKHESFSMVRGFIDISEDDAIRCGDKSVPLENRMVLIRCNENHGFAKGNNIGIEYAFKNFNSEYILLLNSDTIVEREFLGELVKIAEGNLRVGSVQSLLLRPEGKVIDSLGQKLYLLGARDDKSGKMFYPNSLKGDFEIFGSCAAAALYRSSALIDTGLFDEDFYIIYEDVDLSFRLRLAGYISMLATRSIVYHKRGISGGRRADDNIRQTGLYHSYKNWMLLALRYYSISDILMVSRRFFCYLLRWIFYSFKTGKARDFLGLFLRSLNIRKQIIITPRMDEIRKKWMVREKP